VERERERDEREREREKWEMREMRGRWERCERDEREMREMREREREKERQDGWKRAETAKNKTTKKKDTGVCFEKKKKPKSQAKKVHTVFVYSGGASSLHYSSPACLCGGACGYSTVVEEGERGEGERERERERDGMSHHTTEPEPEQSRDGTHTTTHTIVRERERKKEREKERDGIEPTFTNELRPVYGRRFEFGFGQHPSQHHGTAHTHTPATPRGVLQFPGISPSTTNNNNKQQQEKKRDPPKGGANVGWLGGGGGWGLRLEWGWG
jgi:hypothetical protein